MPAKARKPQAQQANRKANAKAAGLDGERIPAVVEKQTQQSSATSWPSVGNVQPVEAVMIPEIMEAVKEPEKFGGVAAAFKFVLDKLAHHGLAKEVHFTPGQLGVHPMNRGGTGCNEEAVHDLGGHIYDVGWDWEKVRGSICVEEDDTRYIEAFNKGMVKNSEYLAPVADRSIMAGTLTNGHTVLLLRALQAGVKTSVQSISVDGCMSLPQVASTRPVMADAARTGWRWTMLTKEVRHIYGNDIFEFLSGVHNVQLSRKEHELEVLLKIFRMATSAAAPIDWSHISRSILRTKPESGEYLQSMIKFIQEFGGGVEAGFVQDLCRFYRKSVPGHRILHGAFFDAVTALKFYSKDLNIDCAGVLLRYALMKANYKCPHDKVSGRICKFITKADMDQLSKKNIAAAAAAEKILRQSREIVLKLGTKVDEDWRTKFFGSLDVNVVRVIMGKQSAFSIKYESVEHAASTFVKDLAVATGETIDNPWASISCSSADKPLVIASAGIKSYSIDGALVASDGLQVLKQNGFDVNMLVIEKQSKTVYKIVNSTAESISVMPLHSDGKDEQRNVAFAKFVSGFSKFVEEFYPMDDKCTCTSNQQWQALTMKSALQFSLTTFAANVGTPAVRVQAKPTKMVIANAVLGKGACVLVPATLQVSVVLDGVAPPLHSVLVEVSGCDMKFALMPQPMTTDLDKKPFIVPYWAVQTTDDEEVGNMAIIEATVELNVNVKKPKFRNVNTTVQIPTMQNTKPLKDGDELFLYVAQSQAAKKRKTK